MCDERHIKMELQTLTLGAILLPLAANKKLLRRDNDCRGSTGVRNNKKNLTTSSTTAKLNLKRI